MSDLLQALYHGDRAKADALLADKPELTIFEAAAAGKTERVREILRDDPSLANAFGDDGFHPLGLACFFGHVDTTRVLLEHGADVNALSRNEHIQTAAIHAAAASEEEGTDEATRYELVKLVLDHGADPDLPQGGGFRAIDAARQNGDQRVEQLLLERGATEWDG
jgi:ankyrin repeat protein